MPDNLRADLDQFHEQAAKRPVFDFTGRNQPLKRILRITFGILFLAFGVTGLFLPLLQGIIFIVVGLLLLAPYSTFIRRRRDAFKKKHPKLYQRAQAVKGRFRRR